MNATTTATTTNDNRPPIWEQSPEELQLTADWVTYRALVTAQLDGYDKNIERLINAAYLDTLWRGLPQRVERAEQARAAAHQSRALATAAITRARRLTTSDANADELLTLAEVEDGVARSSLGDAQDIEHGNACLTASDREDIRQHILATAIDITQRINAEIARGRTPNEDASYIVLKQLYRAARRYMQQLRGVSTLTQSHTDSRLLTVEEARELIQEYHIDPMARPRGKIYTQGGSYYTLESRPMLTAAKAATAEGIDVAYYNQACCWYAEQYTPTALPVGWQSMTPAEQAAALGLDPADNQPLAIVCHGNTVGISVQLPDTDKTPILSAAVDSDTDVDITQLIDCAKLTDRERSILRSMASPAAAQYAASMRNEYLTARVKYIGRTARTKHTACRMRESITAADNVYSAALWEYALTTEDIPEGGRKMCKSRIVKAARAARGNPSVQQVNVPALMCNRYGIATVGEGERADLIQWTVSAPERTVEPPQITAQDYYRLLRQASTPAERRAIERKYLFTVNFVDRPKN